MEKTNSTLPADELNNEILHFCTAMFESWLEDYREAAELARFGSLAHSIHSLTIGVEKNIAEKCLPIDYFVERMLQLGFCSTMGSVSTALEVMLRHDNAGFTEKGPPIIPSKPPSVTASKSPVSMPVSQGKKIQDWVLKKIGKGQDTDDFEAMNYRNKEAIDFLRQQLPRGIL